MLGSTPHYPGKVSELRIDGARDVLFACVAVNRYGLVDLDQRAGPAPSWLASDVTQLCDRRPQLRESDGDFGRALEGGGALCLVDVRCWRVVVGSVVAATPRLRVPRLAAPLPAVTCPGGVTPPAATASPKPVMISPVGPRANLTATPSPRSAPAAMPCAVAELKVAPVPVVVAPELKSCAIPRVFIPTFTNGRISPTSLTAPKKPPTARALPETIRASPQDQPPRAATALPCR